MSLLSYSIAADNFNYNGDFSSNIILAALRHLTTWNSSLLAALRDWTTCNCAVSMTHTLNHNCHTSCVCISNVILWFCWNLYKCTIMNTEIFKKLSNTTPCTVAICILFQINQYYFTSQGHRWWSHLKSFNTRIY